MPLTSRTSHRRARQQPAWRAIGTQAAGSVLSFRKRRAPVSQPEPPATAPAPKTRLVRGWLAIPVLVVIAVVATTVTWATVRIATASFAVKPGHPNAAGPLAYPAPKTAGSLPLRGGTAGDAAERAIIAQFTHRFIGVGLARNERGVHVVRPSGLYGEPGHIDPATGHTAWVMYLGLSAAKPLGEQMATLSRLMTGLLGPGSQVGPWPVQPGPRRGVADCTVAVLGQTQVSVCGWATARTAGAIISPVRDTSAAQLAKIMVAMRFNLEPRATRPAPSRTAKPSQG